MPERKHIVEAVKTGIIESIRGTGEVVDAAVDTVSGTLVNTIKGAGEVSRTAVEQVRAAVSDVIGGVKVVVTEPARPRKAGGSAD